MYKATYYKTDGKKGRARALPDWLFDGVVNEGALHQVVKAYQANQRQANEKTHANGPRRKKQQTRAAVNDQQHQE